jgi:hypothetical protein
MKRIRFNIASLLVVVSVLGVGFAALRESSDLWDSGLFSLALGVLLTSILLAIHRTAKRRAFWMGFALFGWMYLALTVTPSIESTLITTKALALLDSKVPGRPKDVFYVRFGGTNTGGLMNQFPAVAFDSNGNQLGTSSQGTVKLWNATTFKPISGWSGTTENFVRIGHSLFALLVGWLGGQLSNRLCRTSREPEASAAVDARGIGSSRTSSSFT